jgi:hypothetical protein
MHVSAFRAEFLRLLFSVVAGPDEWSALADLEPLRECGVLHAGEFIRVDPPFDGQVVPGGLQVLADGQDVRITPGLDIIHQVVDLVFLLTDPHHDPGLGDQAVGLELLEDLEGSLVLGLRSDGRMHPDDRLHVVGDDLRTCITDQLDILLDALEVPDQDLDTRVRAEFMNRLDGFGPDTSATIGEIIPIDAGDHNMPEVDLGEHLGDPTGLVVVQLHRFPGFDVAETTGSRAGVAEDHDRRGTAGPAFTHVRTTGLLADGMQLVFVDQCLEIEVSLAAGHACTKPVGFLADRQLRRTISVLEDHPGERNRHVTAATSRGVTSQGSGVSRKSS